MDTSTEPGFAKVALYGSSSSIYTHAARQLPDGKWTSKLGKGVDIEHHTPDAVSGPLYGEVMQVMKKSNVKKSTRNGDPLVVGPGQETE